MLQIEHMGRGVHAVNPLSPDAAQIDHSLSCALTVEAEKSFGKGTGAGSQNETMNFVESAAAGRPDFTRPSSAMTYFRSHAWSETNKPSLEVDRQKRAAYTELLELVAALDAMQSKRRGREAETRELIDPLT